MSEIPLPPVRAVEPETIATHLFHVKEVAPLVHCITNDVVQEITANVLLAMGASPAMVVACEEAAHFAAISSALLVNVGTPRPESLEAMHLAAKSAVRHNVPWVLDPVAAGVIPWRDKMIMGLLALQPTVIRGNASEILALAGLGKGGKGVDSTDSSDAALEAAVKLAREYNTIVCVTGKPTTQPTAKKYLPAPAARSRQRLWSAPVAPFQPWWPPSLRKPNIRLKPLFQPVRSPSVPLSKPPALPAARVALPLLT